MNEEMQETKNIKQSSFFIFGSGYDYCAAMCHDLIKQPNCFFNNQVRASLFYKFLHNRFTYKIVGAHGFGLLVPKKKRSKNSYNHFIFFDSNPYLYNENFLRWLRKIKNSTLSLIFVNTMATRNMCDIDYFKRNFDYIYTIDQNDAQDYDFIFCNGIHSKLTEYKQESSTVKIAYAGVAKNRGQQILDVYLALRKLDYECTFTVVGLENAPDEINTTRIPYQQVLAEELGATCILEICVGEQKALTLRAMEAIMYDKFLLTNNKNMVNNSYYDSQKMRILDLTKPLEEQLKDLPMRGTSYQYKGDYSPLKLLQDIEKRSAIL